MAMYSRFKTCVITYDGDYTDLQDDINILFKNGVFATHPIISFFHRDGNIMNY